LYATVNTPLMVPVALGLKAIPMVHDPRAGMLSSAQGFEPAVLTTYSPLVRIDWSVKEMLWLLVKVTTCAGLVVPTDCGLKVSEAGDKVTGKTAIPEMGRTCVLTDALSVKVIDPLMFPGRVGLNLTATVHFALGSNAPPQGVLAVAKK
jgi:hypothetical protein